MRVSSKLRSGCPTTMDGPLSPALEGLLECLQAQSPSLFDSWWQLRHFARIKGRTSPSKSAA